MLRRTLLALALLAPAGSALASTPAEIIARGYLAIGTSGTAPPYSYVDRKNQLIGYDIDLGQAIARALGVRVLWKRMDFRGLLPALAAGQVDLVMSAVRIREKLKSSFLFSQPYSFEETVAVVRAGDHDVRSMGDIRGRDVAVVSSSYQEDVAKAQGGYRTLLSLPNGTDVFLAMHTGHASVGVVGVTAARHYAQQHLDPIRIVEAGAPLAPQGIVLAKRSVALQAFINRLLAERRADGRYAALYRKHFGVDPVR